MYMYMYLRSRIGFLGEGDECEGEFLGQGVAPLHGNQDTQLILLPLIIVLGIDLQGEGLVEGAGLIINEAFS